MFKKYQITKFVKCENQKMLNRKQRYNYQIKYLKLVGRK